jgi:DNA-binding Xre family transcriptional regulator
MLEVRRSSKVLSPERVRELKALAVKIDREEGEEIRAKGRAYLKHAKKLQAIFCQLQAERQRQGLSLTDIAHRTGIDRARLSRLEKMKYPNVTTETLERYAAALNKQIIVSLVDAQE